MKALPATERGRRTREAILSAAAQRAESDTLTSLPLTLVQVRSRSAPLQT